MRFYIRFTLSAARLGHQQVSAKSFREPGVAVQAATKADGLIYVAGTLAAEGDIKAQTKNAPTK